MADNKFLDQQGLQTVWDQIKLKFPTKTDLVDELANYYTEGETDAKIKAAIDALVDGAPEALNTLKELADALEGEEGVIVTM